MSARSQSGRGCELTFKTVKTEGVFNCHPAALLSLVELLGLAGLGLAGLPGQHLTLTVLPQPQLHTHGRESPQLRVAALPGTLKLIRLVRALLGPGLAGLRQLLYSPLLPQPPQLHRIIR